ncbi:MAG: hypothetical protein JWM16_2868 [Verrucomicrobiales bacterium]|nr:hypothetical protein [Verrucomicrobiales bacterium]
MLEADCALTRNRLAIGSYDHARRDFQAQKDDSNHGGSTKHAFGAWGFLLAIQSLGAAPLDDTRYTRLREQTDFDFKEIPQTWGAASNGLTCALKVPANALKATNGIPVELYFKNVGGKPFLITRPYDLSGEPSLWAITVTGPEGEIKYKGPVLQYQLTLAELKPGQVVRYAGTLQPPVWDTTNPGRYALKVKYTGNGPSPGDARPIWSGTIYSNEVGATVK